MARHRWALVALACVVLSASGCSSPPAPVSTPPSSLSADPPALVVQGVGAAVELQPWSYCWVDRCADGAPVHPLPTVGASELVTVSGGPAEFRLTAEFAVADEECPGVRRVTLGEMGDQLSLEPVGPAGTYDVALHIEEGQGRDAAYSFEWATTHDGPKPWPSTSATCTG